MTPNKLSYKAVNQLVRGRNDRPGFSLTMRTKSNSSSSTTPVITNFESSSFNTPFKEGAAGSGASSFAFEKTSNQTSFNTPYKQEPPSTSFKTPVKSKAVIVDENTKTQNTDDSDLGPEAVQTEAESGEPAQYVCQRPVIPEATKKQRLKTKVAQAQRIKEKKARGDTRPVAGGMLSHRRSNTAQPLLQAMGGSCPQSYCSGQVRTVILYNGYVLRFIVAKY